MEAVNAGASVVTFAALAGNGLKELCKAIKAYRDGPHDVEQLLDAVEELNGLIAQLSETLTDRTVIMKPDFESRLVRSLKACKANASAFTVKLQQCKPELGYGPLQWAMCRLRPLLYQSDFEKWRLVILRHLAVFSVHVGVING